MDVLLLIITALGWVGILRWCLRYGSAGWTMTEATIEREYAAAAANNAWKPALQYSYQVAGQFYSGYFILAGAFISREEASAAARPWREKKIFVRYNPERLHESAFLRADGAPPGSRSLGDQPPPSSDMITLSLN